MFEDDPNSQVTAKSQ